MKLPEKYTVGETEYDRNLDEDLFVNMGDINTDFAEHSRKFAWYATAYEICEAQVGKEKDALKNLEARLDFDARQDMEAAGVKATDKKVEATVLTQPSYVAQQSKYRRAELAAGLAKAARDAMMHRKDMLVGLGANYRAEGNADISLKTQQHKNNK